MFQTCFLNTGVDKLRPSSGIFALQTIYAVVKWFGKKSMRERQNFSASGENIDIMYTLSKRKDKQQQKKQKFVDVGL